MDSSAPTGNVASQRLLEHSSALSGWIRKQNFLKKWKKKFTILYDGCVYTYKNETSSKQINVFSLKEFISVTTSIQRKGTKRLWILHIFPANTKNKSKHLAFPSAEDRKIWADRIRTELRLPIENQYNDSEMPYSSFDKAWSKECLSDSNTEYIEAENLKSSSHCHPTTKSVNSIYGSIDNAMSQRNVLFEIPWNPTYPRMQFEQSDIVEDYVDPLSSNSYSSRQSITSLQGYEIEGSDKACKDSTFKCSDLQVGVGRRPLPTQPSSPRYHRKTTTGKEHINRKTQYYPTFPRLKFEESDIGRRPLPPLPSSPRYHRKTTTEIEHIYMNEPLIQRFSSTYSKESLYVPLYETDDSSWILSTDSDDRSYADFSGYITAKGGSSMDSSEGSIHQTYEKYVFKQDNSHDDSGTDGSSISGDSIPSYSSYYTHGSLTDEVDNFDKLNISGSDSSDVDQTSCYEEINRFYKIPFTYGLELVIDSRLDREFEQRIQTHMNKTGIYSKRTYNSTDEFLHMYELRTKFITTVLPTIHLIDAIQNDKELRVRWLLSNFDSANIFGEVFQKALELNKIRIAKAIAWVITNNFFIRYKLILHLIKFRIWPGFRCICNKKDVAIICSNRFEIIIESTKIEKNIPHKFAGFNVRQVPYDKESKEAKLITSRLSKYWETDVCCDNIVISKRKAESLFDNHSNLTLICSSVIQSKGMPLNHKVESVQCIQLYCTLKGVIPIGERHFPSSVCHYPTDVMEGCPVLATQIKIGDKVGTTDSLGQFKSKGTLGGFINHFGFPCFLTCAHVVFDLQTLLGRIPNDIDNKGIDVFTPSSYNAIPIHCGRVLRRVFEHSDKDKTSIDAALVYILHGVSVDPQHCIVDHFGFSRPFAELGFSSMDLNEICIDIASICNSKADVLCPGGFIRIKDKVVIKSQEEYLDIQFPVSGIPVQPQPSYSQPLMIATTAHMQLRPGNLAGQRVFRMYNQLLLNLPLNLGDSGTCIYIIDANKRKGCIGMAIAFLSAGQCIITPLKEILKKIKH